MASDKAPLSSRPHLGVLAQFPESDVADLSPVLETLNKHGLSHLTEELHSALQISLVHSTYLYENTRLLPSVTNGLLDALNRLGGALLRKMTAAEAYQQSAFVTAGSLSKQIAHTISTFPTWAGQQHWLRQSVALGKGLTREPLPERIMGNMLRQLLGALSLCEREDVVEKLLKEFIESSNLSTNATVSDPKTLLHVQLKNSAMKPFEYQQEGPDHAIVFRAVFTDDLGRKGVGIGNSKKEASQNASLDFLRRHIPAALSPPQGANRYRREVSEQSHVGLREILTSQGHSSVVRRVQGLFNLPAAARPLLSQALIHASWAYENRFQIQKAKQQDNQVLAFMGSQVLEYEHTLATVRSISDAPPEIFTFNGISNDAYNDVFSCIDLSSGVLLGKGQATKEIPAELGANVLQAVLGAVFISRNYPRSLGDNWPTAWAAVWELIARTELGLLEPTSKLQQVCSAIKLNIEYEFQSSGPHHQQQFQSTIVIKSPILNVQTSLAGAISTSKTKAKHNASRVVLRVLEALAETRKVQLLADGDRLEKSLAQFLLAHQFSVLATPPAPLQRWAADRIFGLHLASTPARLLEWAGAADQLLGLNIDLQPNNFLQAAFRSVVDTAINSTETLRAALAELLELLERLEAPEEIAQGHLDYLVQLCAIYRCLGAKEYETDLTNLITDWRTLYRDKLLVLQGVPHQKITGRERAILDAAASAVLSSSEILAVEVMYSDPLHLRFLVDTPLDRASTKRMCELWSGVTRTTKLHPAEQGINVIITRGPTSSVPGPITRAVEAAFSPSPLPYQAAIADLLHDLKNLLGASRLAATQPAETRTAKLQQQLIASRHLDDAQAITVRLRATGSLLRPTGTQSVELGTFLRHYASTILSRLPGKISLSVPEAVTVANVPLDARALAAILDNLVGNAIEAMRDGGAITLQWTADDYEALIEVADNGPGLPADVITAFEHGGQIRSTKPGGNGLGLLGVRSLLARAGGQLAYDLSRPGTSWLISLPIASTDILEHV